MSKKAHTALDEVDAKGGFVRTAATYDNEVKEGTRFAPEAGRYHLYVAMGCPWANGTLTAMYWKGLDKVISYSVVHPTWAKTRPNDPEDTHTGWQFCAPGDPPVANTAGHGSFDCDDALVPDTVNGKKYLRDVYLLADPECTKYTTPVLWDKKEKTIVNNESTKILRIFDSSFQKLAEHPENILFPPEKQAEADALNEWIYPNVNNGVYRCGFARGQDAYEGALKELFASLDRLDDLLGKGGPFLTGSQFTWIDLRVYMTLVRFDPVYHTYFKTNLKKIADYPNLLKFMRSCYAIPAVKKTTNIKHIKMHYFTSHPVLNTYGIIPGSNGPDLEGKSSSTPAPLLLGAGAALGALVTLVATKLSRKSL